MVLVDVDIVAGSDDGYGLRGGYLINGTAYTQTSTYLTYADANSVPAFKRIEDISFSKELLFQ